MVKVRWWRDAWQGPSRVAIKESSLKSTQQPKEARLTMADVPSGSKYSPENLIPMFRKAASLRNEMRDSGFTDNGGAIHSAERILDILGQRLNYCGLSHINNLRNYPGAEFSPAALKAHERGEKIKIEHVSPRRALTRGAIREIDHGASDQEFTDYVRQHYRLVLLTDEETRRLNRINRSEMTRDRLGSAGISVVKRHGN